MNYKETPYFSKEIIVYPNDPKFSNGTFHCVVNACEGGVEHSIGIQLELSEVKPVVPLSEVKTTYVIKDSLFLKYDAEVTEECPDLS